MRSHERYNLTRLLSYLVLSTFAAGENPPPFVVKELVCVSPTKLDPDLRAYHRTEGPVVVFRREPM